MVNKSRGNSRKPSHRPLARQLDDAIGKPRRRARSKPVTVPVEGDSLRLHRASGQGYVLVEQEGGGRRRAVYLGPFFEPDGETVSQEAIQAARRLLREARLGALRPASATGRSVARALRSSGASGVTVADLARRFIGHVEKKYARRATQIPHYAGAMQRLVEHAGDLPAEEFGPVLLAALRDAMVRERDPKDPERSRYVRRSVNECVARIVRAFRWGVSVELVPESVHRSLETLEPIERGEVPDLRESRKVTGVPLADVRAVLPFLSRQLAAVVRLQVLTGARPSELLGLRSVDVDRSGERWIARPVSHKNAWRGGDHEREIVLPREAEPILEPFIENRLPTAPLFSPAEAEAERQRERSEARRSDPRFGNKPGYNSRTRKGREPGRRPGRVYTSDSYRRALERACATAGVDRFTPYRLRHLAGELAERALDEVHTSALLGHRDENTSRRYHSAQQRKRRAAAAADALGVTVARALESEETA